MAAAAWVAAAPLLWALSDLIVTGDPLHSLVHTREVAAEIGRRTGASQTPGARRTGCARSCGRPSSPAGSSGSRSVLRMPRRPLLVALAPVVLGLAGFVAIGVADLPLNARYLLLPAVFLLVLAAHAALGWLPLPAGGIRRVWIAGAAVLALLMAAVVPDEVRKAGTSARTCERRPIRSETSRRCCVAISRRCRAVVSWRWRTVRWCAWPRGSRSAESVGSACWRWVVVLVSRRPGRGRRADRRWRAALPSPDERAAAASPARAGDVGNWRLEAVGC